MQGLPNRFQKRDIHSFVVDFVSIDVWRAIDRRQNLTAPGEK